MKTRSAFAVPLSRRALAGSLALLILPYQAHSQVSQPTMQPAQATQAPVVPLAPVVLSNDPLVLRGAYLAHAGDCIACHTATNRKPFAGGLPMHTPFGTIYSTNITPDKTTGIGDYSLEDFDKALRKGIAKRTGHLYPAMPYPSYRLLSDDDVKALYAYFMHGLTPVAQPNHDNVLGFPFNQRALMIGWDLLFLKRDGPYKDDPSKSVEWNRGAYLVQGLGHCGACHTPHGLLGQEKSANETSSAFLGGATLDGWNAPPLSGDPRTGLGNWSNADIVAFLKTGRTLHEAAFGAMTEVVNDSTQYLSDADLQAMASYLKSLASYAPGANGIQASSPVQATMALRGGNLDARGARVYLNSCDACHRSDGSGAQYSFPSLANNPVVNSSDPTSLIHLVLAGSSRPSTVASPAPLAMPDFGWRLDNQQIADVLTFIRSNWGNQAPAVSTDSVAKLRHAESQ